MANLSETEIGVIWQKAMAVDGYDNTKYRKDVCGAWIQRDQYGKETIYGWEIDHAKPTSKGGSDDAHNLRPMHWQNNRTKADDYPTYNSAVTSEGNGNVEKTNSWTIKT